MPAIDFDTAYREFKQADWLRIRQQRIVDQQERDLASLRTDNAAARDRLRRQAVDTHPAAQPAAVAAVPVLSVDEQRALQTQRMRRHVESVERGNALRSHNRAVLQAAFQLESGIRLTRSGPLPALGEVHRCQDCGGTHR